MNAQEHIENRLDELKLSAKPAPDFKSNEDLADFIFKTALSKKFRKFSVTPEYLPRIHEAIKINCGEKK